VIVSVDFSIYVDFIPGKEYPPGSQLDVRCVKPTQTFLGTSSVITCMGLERGWVPDYTKLRCITRY